ncbi:hypothetical protein BALCAV_0216310 [Alkalihalobacillus alcalophilus ATCC 27647 = CGMCC 1.3604]|uniref:Transposase n=1 Tax=Alkalihalobacillus alcalophilus ATCC 27647 = CGMCC 1.3604 TaxID=1218173 RepID=A0A094XC91_ALKAL|nr:hypothetical protein BALCAV_0216310 [Alkalihalobacillus alcalophilus ATCC 27647 = CGMCC 1.3604]
MHERVRNQRDDVLHKLSTDLIKKPRYCLYRRFEHQEGKKSLEIRDWTCPICDKHHDRDIDASQNGDSRGNKPWSETPQGLPRRLARFPQDAEYGFGSDSRSSSLLVNSFLQQPTKRWGQTVNN